MQISKAGLLNEASEIDSVGNVIRIGRNGKRKVVADDLASPYGVAAGRRGHVYVTTHSTTAGGG